MPQTDVSFVLDNPMFNSSGLSVLRTPVLPNGLPDTQNQMVIPLNAVVMPGTVEPLALTDDASRANRWINVHTRQRLYDVTPTYQPDVVIYQGNSWKVMKPYDYSTYGAGFYAYDCELQDLTSALTLRPAMTPTIFAIGVNLSGLEDGSNVPGTAYVDYAVPTTAEMDYYKSLGASYIRLPARWDRLQPTVHGPLDPTHLGYIQTLVAHGAMIGLPVLLDLAHNFGGREIGGVGHQLGDGTLTNAMFADYATKLATIFGGVAGVYGIDIMNEPSNMPNPQAWPSAAQAYVTAYRMVDTATTLYIEGDNYSSAGSWLEVNHNLNIVDPSNNLIYSAHCYYDRDSSGRFFSWVTENATPLASSPNIGNVHTIEVGVQRLTPFLTWLKMNGFRGHIGEGGVAVDQNTDPTNLTTYNPNYLTDGWNVCLDTTVAYVQSENLPFTYWSAGPYSTSGYPLGIEPSIVNGVTQQAKQVAVLLKYTGASGNPAAFLTGPTRGTANLPSAAFTLDVRDYLTAEETFTPTDNGAGGTFLPSSITLLPGFNGLATFTYTAASATVARIGVTCPARYTPPAPMGYSTKDDIFLHLTAQPRNIYSADLIYTPYIGPVIRVYQSTDTAMANPRDFYPTLLATDGVTYTVDQSAVEAFAGTTGQVFYYDQSPNGWDQGPVSFDNQNGATTATTVNGVTTYTSAPLGPSLADVPVLAINAQNGKPAANRANTRVDAISPLDKQTTMGWFCIAKPSTVAGMENYFGWQFIDYYAVAGDANGDWQMSNETSQYLSLDVDSSAFHSYSGGYSGGVGGVWQVYRDGLLVSSATPGASAITYSHRNNLRIGYAPFTHVMSSVLDAELIIFDRAPSASDHQVLHASAQARWATPIPPAQVTGLTLGTTAPTTQVLAWNAAAGATGYTVQYRVTGGPSWSTATTMDATTSYTVTGLSSLTTYDYRVFATAGAGVGPVSGVVTARTLPYPPGPELAITNIGVNLSGPENYPYPIIPNAAQIAYWASLGTTIIRLPSNWSNWTSTLGGSLNTGYQSSYVAAVNAITGTGMICVVDIHDYGTYNGVQIGTAPVTNAAFAYFIGQIAALFASNPLVWIELQNEPAQSNDGAWIASQNAAIAAARTAGFNNTIVWSPCHGGNAGTFGYDIAGYATGMVDTANNLVMSVHNYFDSDQSGRLGTVPDPTVPPYYFYRVTNWARRYGIKLFLGEFGAGTGSDGIACVTNVMEYLQANADIWTAATIWGAGDFGAAPGYALGIAPTDNTGAANYSNPVNTSAQIIAMLPYMTGGVRRGQTPQPILTDYSNMGSGTFNGPPIFSGYGPSCTGGSSVQVGNLNYTDLDVMTLEAVFNVTANGSGQYICGGDGVAGFSIDAAGNLGGWYGNQYGSGYVRFTTTRNVSGIAVKAAISVGPSGGALYVNGTQVATSTTSYVASNPSGGLFRGRYNYASPVGEISDVALYAAQLYTGNYTPPAIPRNGTEHGLIGYWPLGVDGRCYL